MALIRKYVLKIFNLIYELTAKL